jgi:acyl-CoA synthetase (AMP-forming)/AMP-acid ligase II
MGKPLPGFDVAVLRADGSPVPPGEVGEIAVRRGAPSMFLGYWNQPDKTAAKFRATGCAPATWAPATPRGISPMSRAMTTSSPRRATGSGRRRSRIA